MTLRDLAAATGYHLTQIQRVESNARDMNVTQLFAFARALQVDPRDILRTAVEAAGGLDSLWGQSPPAATPSIGANGDLERTTEAVQASAVPETGARVTHIIDRWPAAKIDAYEGAKASAPLTPDDDDEGDGHR